MHWREYFAVVNRYCYQASQVPEERVKSFVKNATIGNTEAMYQAFKARMAEEGLLLKQISDSTVQSTETNNG